MTILSLFSDYYLFIFIHCLMISDYPFFIMLSMRKGRILVPNCLNEWLDTGSEFSHEISAFLTWVSMLLGVLGHSIW